MNNYLAYKNDDYVPKSLPAVNSTGLPVQMLRQIAKNFQIQISIALTGSLEDCITYTKDG